MTDHLCEQCLAGLTSTDFECGRCTQCEQSIRELAGETTMLPEIVKRAMAETVTDIGQLSKYELCQLNRYVRRGWLSKGKAGPFPRLKTVYACPGFDFEASRKRYVDETFRVYEIEKQLRANGHFDVMSPNYGKPLQEA